MNLLVTYDVNTQTKEGERRLRQVAKICLGFGQRVQGSVFECQVTMMERERFRQKLLDVIDPKLDNLRIYRLAGKREEVVEAYGQDFYRDLTAPLIV